MNYHVLYNPFAGNREVEDEVSVLSVIYNAEFIYHDITKINRYTDLFSEIDTDDIVILCGGDGTLNRFVNATSDTEIPCDILYFALGTGNDFLRDLNRAPNEEPFSIKEYIKNLPTVTVNGNTYRFLNNVGFGIDGYCCEVGDRLKSSSDKPINYTSIAIKGLLFYYKPTNAIVTVDGKEYTYQKVWLAPTMKGRFYGGGMMAAPDQNRCDPEGRLSLMLFHGAGRLKTLIAFPSIFKGTHTKHTDMVAIHQGKDIHVKFNRPSPLQIDGETILGVTEYRATTKTPTKIG